MILVTLITRSAGTDDLSEQDYRDIYEEVNPRDANGKPRYSLDKFVSHIASHYTKATWSNWLADKHPSTRIMRAELRAAMDLKPLPPTIAELALLVDEHAEIWAVGDGPKNRVILASKEDRVQIHTNGVVTAHSGRVIGITRATRKRLRRDMSAEQAKAWDGLTEAQRNERLGL